MIKKILTLLTIVVLVGCGQNLSQYKQDVEFIEENFSLLEKYEVRSFNSLDGCKSIIYKRGYFFDNACNRAYPTDAQAFDAEAQAVFDEVENAMKKVKVFNIYNTEYENGELVSGGFNFNSNTLYDRYRYYYDPDHKISTSIQPYCEGEIWVTPINQDWYFECEDWN